MKAVITYGLYLLYLGGIAEISRMLQLLFGHYVWAQVEHSTRLGRLWMEKALDPVLFVTAFIALGVTHHMHS